MLLAGKFEPVVVGILNSKSVKSSSSDRFAASWASTMAGVHSDWGIQFFQLLDRIEEHACQISTCDVGGYCEVGPSHFSQENCVSREEADIFSGWIHQLEAGTLEGMSWGVDNFDFDVTEAEDFSIGALVNLKGVDGSGGGWSHNDGSIKLGMPWEEVGMVVGEEDVFEFGTSWVHEFFVCFNIEDRIDEEAFFLGLEVVGEDGEFWGFELANVETLAVLFGGKGESWVHLKIS